MSDLLTHLKPITLEEIEADLQDIYLEFVHGESKGPQDLADIGLHLAAIGEELVRRKETDA